MPTRIGPHGRPHRNAAVRLVPDDASSPALGSDRYQKLMGRLPLRHWNLRQLTPIGFNRLFDQRAARVSPVFEQLSEVVALLTHADVLVVAAAAIRLVEMRETLHTQLQEYVSTVVDSLVVVAMQEPVTSANRAALNAAAVIDPERIYPLVEKMIKDPKSFPEMGQHAREALRYLPTLPAPAYPLLAQILKDPDARVRASAFEALARDTPEARALIVPIVDSTLELIARDAEAGDNNDEASDIINNAISGAQSTLETFSEMPGMESLDGRPLDPYWREAIWRVDQALVRMPVEALYTVQLTAGWMGRSGHELLRRHIENPGRRMRMDAFDMLNPHSVGHNGLESVIRLTRSRYPDVAAEAKKIMAKLTINDVKHLVSCLESSDGVVRSEAMTALRRFGFAAIAPLDKLIKSGKYHGEQLMLMADIREGIAVTLVANRERQLRTDPSKLPPDTTDSLLKLRTYSLPMLEDVARGRNDLAAMEAIAILSNMGLPGRDSLARLSQHPSTQVRVRVQGALENMDSYAVSDMLRRIPERGVPRLYQRSEGSADVDGILKGALKGVK